MIGLPCLEGLRIFRQRCWSPVVIPVYPAKQGSTALNFMRLPALQPIARVFGRPDKHPARSRILAL